MIERDSHTIVKLLQKKQRASAPELGTDVSSMKVLEAAGVVKQDGTIKTGQRGRPPVAWVIREDADLTDLPLIEEPNRRDSSQEVSQTQIDKVIADVKKGPHGPSCRCDLKPGTPLKTLREMGTGCTGKAYVCPALDATRRRLGF